ncbi:MAG TPA: FecR family protein [Pirellulales bacterium]|nr:FecR family protein [Pirellulales bacterium]
MVEAQPEASKPIESVPYDTDHPGTNHLEPDRAPVLARVSEQTADCQWYFDRSGKVPTDMVRSGDTVRVTNGMMKLLFDNETIVTLHSPAIFEVVSEMRARVLLGKVTAKIGPKAKGFSVVTPQATVIDLGTEFGIEVNELGATDVVVFKGAVDVDYPTTLEGTARQQRLRTGEAVHLDASGTASRIVSITNGQFSDKPVPEPLRPPIITAVRDNIQRESSAAWNYYEIVHNGMAEDAKAFVDREAHEWNGVTVAGLPPYLLGGDYVKTFNNDKVKHDIEINITVARPCRLFILFDDRIPAPAWLQESFRNTGDKIGVDEGPYVVNGKLRTEHQSGVGPGVSIDNVDSVWERDILVPGSVQLGATETPISSINMYGIVAVPLDEIPQKLRDRGQVRK